MAPIWSVIANRKDKANQQFWTEYRVNAVDGCCPAAPGDIVLLGPDCKIAPCLLPSSTGLVIEIDGTPSPCQDVLNFIPGTGIEITYSPDCGYVFTATGIVACGSAGYLCTPPGNCPVDVQGSAPQHAGQVLISQPGNCSAVWADPMVQGLYPPGTNVFGANPGSPPTPLNPVLIGGADCNGDLQNLALTTNGEVIVLAQDQETDPAVQRFAATTGQNLVTSGTGLTPLLSITPKAGAASVTFTFRDLDFASGGQVCHFQLLLNATLTGASFVNVDPASSMTYDVSATSYTGGRLIDAGFVGADSRHNDYEFNFAFAAAVPPTITLVFAPASRSSKTPCAFAGCAFAWDEQTSCL